MIIFVLILASKIDFLTSLVCIVNMLVSYDKCLRLRFYVLNDKDDGEAMSEDTEGTTYFIE